MVLFHMILRTVLVEKNLGAVSSDSLAEISKHFAANLPKNGMTVTETIHRFSHGLNYAAFPFVGRHAVLLVFALCGLLYAWLSIWSLRHRGRLEIARRDTLLATVPIIARSALLWLVAGTQHCTLVVYAAIALLFFALAPSIALMMLPDQLT